MVFIERDYLYEENVQLRRQVGSYGEMLEMSREKDSLRLSLINGQEEVISARDEEISSLNKELERRKSAGKAWKRAFIGAILAFLAVIIK